MTGLFDAELDAGDAVVTVSLCDASDAPASISASVLLFLRTEPALSPLSPIRLRGFLTAALLLSSFTSSFQLSVTLNT